MKSKVALAALLLALTALALARADLVEKDLKSGSTAAAPPPSPEEAPWRAVLGLAGAKVSDKQSITATLSALPTAADLKAAGAYEPAAFLALHDQGSEAVQKAMERQVRARLRDLSRRGVFKSAAVDALLGPEPEGVPGSKLYEIPPVPGESFFALVDYLELSATLVSGQHWQPSAESHRRLIDQLRVSLSISSAAGRNQYRDFDVVYALVRREMALTPEADRRELLPGLVWLYRQVRDPAGLDFLPPVPPGLAQAVDDERGEWFSRARQESGDLPDSLAALTDWPAAPAEGPIER